LLLFVGALRYYKGLQYLIRAMARIPPANLLIVGSGPMRSEWEHLADQVNVSERVHFLGHVDSTRLPICYQACDLFVLPSHMRAEAFGLAMVEAMASGRPVVSTELGTGTSYVNQHGHTGRVVKPADPEALATALGDLLHDASQRLAMGSAARARACAEFSLPVMVERVQNVYEQILRHQL
jgi:rhamnosyl/mannosyltransferase